MVVLLCDEEVARPIYDQAARGEAPAPIEAFAFEIDRSVIREKPEAPFQEAKQSVDLSQAERIVAVGRGIKGQEHLPVVQKLAAELSSRSGQNGKPQ